MKQWVVASAALVPLIICAVLAAFRDSVTAATAVLILVLLVVIGAAMTEVALWGYRQQARATRRAGYLEGVFGTAEIVTLRTDDPDSLTTPSSSAGLRFCSQTRRVRS